MPGLLNIIKINDCRAFVFSGALHRSFKPNDEMKKQTFTILALLAFGMAAGPPAMAQQSLNASGGNATGAGGTASYSVGQLAYTSATGTGGSATAGVQQAIEIFVSTKEELESIRLSASAFPNPVESDLTLQITDMKWRDLSYELIDLSGKTLLTSSVKGETTKIPFSNQVVGTYTLRVVQGNNEIKSFKILKNK